MSFEHAGFESEKKRKELSDAEKKEAIHREIDAQKRLDTIRSEIDQKKELAYLKSLVERGLLDISSVEKVIRNESLTHAEIAPILEKIDEIDRLDPEEKILPKSLRISEAQYLNAVEDRTHIPALLTLLDQSLDYVSQSVSIAGDSLLPFMAMLSVVSKNLRHIQGNLIDIKRSLQ